MEFGHVRKESHNPILRGRKLTLVLSHVSVRPGSPSSKQPGTFHTACRVNCPAESCESCCSCRDAAKNTATYAKEREAWWMRLVDGNQKSGINSPVEVGSWNPIIYKGFFYVQTVVVCCFLHRQFQIPCFFVAPPKKMFFLFCFQTCACFLLKHSDFCCWKTWGIMFVNQQFSRSTRAVGCCRGKTAGWLGHFPGKTPTC